LNPGLALTAPDRSADLSALAVWHAGWAGIAAVIAGAVVWLVPDLGIAATVAVWIMVLPGLCGLGLMWRDGWKERALVLGAWSLACVSASALTGGITGSLVGYIVMPLVAGAALGGRRLAQVGALALAVCGLVGMISALLSGPGPSMPSLAAIVILLVAGAAALALRMPTGQVVADMPVVEEGTDDTAVRVESLLTSQPGLTLVLDTSGRVLAAYGSPPPGLDMEALYAQGLLATVNGPDRATVQTAFGRALTGHDAQATFATGNALDRRVVLFLKRQEVPGAEPRLIGQAFDGTPQFAREVGLEAARAEAEAQNAGKSRFLANMSHELRTPLNAVIGFSDIMRQRLFGPLPDKYADYAQSIHAAGGHLLDLINDVLDVSKIEAERYELSVERFDARDVVSAAMALVRLSADDKGVELAGVLPPQPTEVEADRRALKQITLNLLSNAIKFTPAKGAVTVTLEAVGPYLEIVVADTGVGIAPDDLRRLGRPFEQAGGADQKAQGTGLGLSLVRALAELHGGRMTMDSTMGEGTAVTVRLPVVATARPATEATGAEIIPLRSV